MPPSHSGLPERACKQEHQELCFTVTGEFSPPLAGAAAAEDGDNDTSLILESVSLGFQCGLKTSTSLRILKAFLWQQLGLLRHPVSRLINYQVLSLSPEGQLLLNCSDQVCKLTSSRCIFILKVLS